MGDEKNKLPWKTWYSPTTSRKDLEKRIGITMKRLYSTAITVQQMLFSAGYYRYKEGHVDSIKDEVYQEIVRYLKVVGITEANVHDLVLFIIVPIIDTFIQRTDLDTVQLFREKQPIPEAGRYEEFLRIEVTEERHIFIFEAKKGSLGKAMDQCLLAMKDRGDSSNHGGYVHGFITSGDTWRMLRYDARDGSFAMSNKIEVVFDTMGREQKRWMKHFSAIVDCVYAALSISEDTDEDTSDMG